MKKINTIIFVLFMMIYTPGSQATLLLHEDFESPMIPYNEPGCRWRPVNIDSSVSVQAPVRLGVHANRLTLNYTDPWGTNPSSELSCVAAGAKNQPIGSTWWYGFSVFFPNNYNTDLQCVVTQLFPSADSGESWTRHPIIALYSDNGYFRLIIRSCADPINGMNDTVQYAQNIAPLEVGVWIDFIFKIKLDYSGTPGMPPEWNATGITQVWKDGVLVVDYTGPNCFNDQKGPAWKHGPYHGDWRSGPDASTQWMMYFDEIKVGDENSSYAEMETPVDEDPPVPPPTGYKAMVVGGTKKTTIGGAKIARIGISGSAQSSVDFASYFEGSWEDPTYTMDVLQDVDDGDNTGTKESSATISTSQAYSGTHSLYISSQNDSLNFDFTHTPSEFNIDFYVYIPSLTSGNNQVFEIYCNDPNRYRCHIQTDGTVKVEYVSSGSWVIFTTTATIPEATWTHIEIKTSVSANKLSVRVGNGSWEDYSGSNVVGVFTENPTEIEIGSRSLGASGAYIDDFKYKIN
jgi:hypothetical protein